MTLFDDHSGAEVYQDRDALLDEHIPDDLVARDDELDSYLKALIPAYEGYAPDHVFLFGPNGSGKTAATRFMMRELRASDESDVDLSTIWLRCNGVGTDYMLAIKIANKILPSDEQVNHGHPEDKIYGRLFDALEKIGGTVIIVLDEINRIEDLDTFLFEVTRARSAGGRLEDTKLGVIGISTTEDYYENLSTDVESSLNHKTIDFDAYIADQLREILSNRVETAFADDAIDDAVIPLCAAIASRYSGDARFALDLLRQAGDLAKTSGDDVVTESHIRDAKDLVLENRAEKKIQNLNHEAQRVLYALAVLAVNGETSPRTTTVYDQYREICRQGNSDPVVSEQVGQYLNKINDVGLTTIEENKGTGGRYNLHSLEYEVDDLVAGLGEHIESTTIMPAIEGLVEPQGVGS